MKRTPPLQPARQINVDVKGMTEAFTFDQGGYARMHACMHVCMCNERRRENELRDERAVVVRAQLLNFWSCTRFLPAGSAAAENFYSTSTLL